MLKFMVFVIKLALRIEWGPYLLCLRLWQSVGTVSETQNKIEVIVFTQKFLTKQCSWPTLAPHGFCHT